MRRLPYGPSSRRVREGKESPTEGPVEAGPAPISGPANGAGAATCSFRLARPNRGGYEKGRSVTHCSAQKRPAPLRTVTGRKRLTEHKNARGVLFLRCAAVRGTCPLQQFTP